MSKSNMYDSPTTALYGFTTLPADQAKTPPSTGHPASVDAATIETPDTPLAKRVLAYAKSKLDEKTVKHSLRVYTYGMAIARECYPDWGLAQEGEKGEKLRETWFLTAMLHDIGTCGGHIDGTRLSFEFWGGYHALNLLQDPSVTGHGDGVAPREQAESVCEAIIRHQDVQDKGSVTLMTRLIHFGTLLDNAGAMAELVSKETIESVNQRYGREGWSGCFRGVVEKEKELKPYAMVSRIEGFEDMIAKNGPTATKEG